MHDEEFMSELLSLRSYVMSCRTDYAEQQLAQMEQEDERARELFRKIASGDGTKSDWTEWFRESGFPDSDIVAVTDLIGEFGDPDEAADRYLHAKRYDMWVSGGSSDDCYSYGSISGCDFECPALLNGKCENYLDVIVQEYPDCSEEEYSAMGEAYVKFASLIQQ